MLYRLFQYSRRVLRLVFSVALIRFSQCICRIVGFFEVVGLERRCPLEGLTSFFARLLQAEGVRSLRVELDRVFVFLCLPAE